MLTINLYTFNELSPEARSVAIEEARANGLAWTDHDSHELREFFIEWLRARDFEPEEVFFSLSHNQGDGVCFTGGFNIPAKARELLNAEDYARICELFKDYDFDWSLEHIGRYYHEHSMQIDWDDLDADDWGNESALLENFAELLIKDARRAAGELERIGYERLDAAHSDSAIAEMLSENDQIMFLENGQLVPSYLLP